MIVITGDMVMVLLPFMPEGDGVRLAELIMLVNSPANLFLQGGFLLGVGGLRRRGDYPDVLTISAIDK